MSIVTIVAWKKKVQIYAREWSVVEVGRVEILANVIGSEELTTTITWWLFSKIACRVCRLQSQAKEDAASISTESHRGWAKKDTANMTLLRIAEADVRERHSAIRAGN